VGIGPELSGLCAIFRQQFRREPEYIAAGSFAVGLIFAESVRHAGSLQDSNLLAAAAAQDCYCI